MYTMYGRTQLQSLGELVAKAVLEISVKHVLKFLRIAELKMRKIEIWRHFDWIYCSIRCGKAQLFFRNFRLLFWRLNPFYRLKWASHTASRHKMQLSTEYSFFTFRSRDFLDFQAIYGIKIVRNGNQL